MCADLTNHMSAPFDDKMPRLTNNLAAQFKQSAKLERAIMKNLASLGFSSKGPA